MGMVVVARGECAGDGAAGDVDGGMAGVDVASDGRRESLGLRAVVVGWRESGDDGAAGGVDRGMAGVEAASSRGLGLAAVVVGD